MRREQQEKQREQQREQQRVLLVKYGFEPHEHAAWQPANRSITPRQRLALELYARLGIQKAVAEAMGVSLQTVKNTLQEAYSRLDSTNCIEAFTELGWLVVRPEEWSDEPMTSADPSYWTLRVISGEDEHVGNAHP